MCGGPSSLPGHNAAPPLSAPPLILHLEIVAPPYRLPPDSPEVKAICFNIGIMGCQETDVPSQRHKAVANGEHLVGAQGDQISGFRSPRI